MNNETKYVHLTFVHRRTGLIVSLNVNNTAGVFNSQLISHFNQTDKRFHKLSIFLLRWHKAFLIQESYTANSGKPMHLISVYALQLMLLTWMQEHQQMAKFDFSHIEHDSDIQNFTRDGQLLMEAMAMHTELQNEFRPETDGCWREAKLFHEFVNFLANKKCDTFFNMPQGRIMTMTDVQLKELVNLGD